MNKISVVINTFNEEKSLGRAIASIKGLADEIIVVDMGSEDGTREVAKRFGAKVYSHKKVDYVELARNYALRQAQGDWILILDPDETASPALVKHLRGILKATPKADYYRIPRKNIIFGKWMEYTRWWPDYNIRFFRKGYVSWNEAIHSVPITKGFGVDMPAKEGLAIIHRNYDSLDGYFEKMLRYTKAQSGILANSGYVFKWTDLVERPVQEFLGRYFVGEGYKDGLHGLAMSLLQSFSELLVYLRLWENQGFKKEEIIKRDIKKQFNKSIREIKWWMKKKFSWLRYLASR